MQKLRLPFKESTMLCGYKTQRYLNAWGYPHYGIDISTYQGKKVPDHTIYASGVGTVVAQGGIPSWAVHSVSDMTMCIITGLEKPFL